MYRCIQLLLLSYSLSRRANAQDTDNNEPACVPNSLKISSDVVGRPPRLLIAHRGASYHLPEHTLEAYRLALELGADFVEPDLVATQDGALIAVHTVDLNVTTNVEEVFADRSTYSAFANRTGYWSYLFTADEIKQLKVKQRIPTRNADYNDMFGVPFLEDILTLVNKWNDEDLRMLIAEETDVPPPGHATALQLAQSGIYAELKDTEWLATDANLDLVDLFYQHLEDHQEHWRQLLPCLTGLKFDQYKVPGLVVQSFDAEALQNFHQRWLSSDWHNTAPEPPYILLTARPQCLADDFWFQIGDDYRQFLSGLGCEKDCLWAESGAALADKAEEYSLVLHPWTSRPEREYLLEGFATLEAETRYLFCDMHAGGIFSEAVEVSRAVAEQGCPSDKKVPEPVTNHSSSDNSLSPPSVCIIGSDKEDLYLGLASFVMGVFVSGLCALCVGRRRRRRYRGTAQVPTQADLELEMT